MTDANNPGSRKVTAVRSRGPPRPGSRGAAVTYLEFNLRIRASTRTWSYPRLTVARGFGPDLGYTSALRARAHDDRRPTAAERALTRGPAGASEPAREVT